VSENQTPETSTSKALRTFHQAWPALSDHLANNPAGELVMAFLAPQLEQLDELAAMFPPEVLDEIFACCIDFCARLRSDGAGLITADEHGATIFAAETLEERAPEWPAGGFWPDLLASL
jgi:hypothetical protein